MHSALLALVISSAQIAHAESIQTVSLNSNEMHKATENVSFGIPFFGLTYLSFGKPNERNPNNIQGFHHVTVWDNGKLVTVRVSKEDWQETRVRTTNGCERGRRISKATFDFSVTQQVEPKTAKPIEGSAVKLVYLSYYSENQPK